MLEHVRSRGDLSVPHVAAGHPVQYALDRVRITVIAVDAAAYDVIRAKPGQVFGQLGFETAQHRAGLAIDEHDIFLCVSDHDVDRSVF